MNLESKLKTRLNKLTKRVENKIKNHPNMPVRTGRLKSSIKVWYDKGVIHFAAEQYGKFQDEGTYRGRKETDISKKVWPKYIARGRGNPDSRGILANHFTDPLKLLGKVEIVSEVKPFIIDEMKEQVKKEITKK